MSIHGLTATFGDWIRVRCEVPQTAVPADPVANRRGIGDDHLASRFGSEIFSTVVVDQPRRMKTQDRPLSDADPVIDRSPSLTPRGSRAFP
jgi:hypothetical protein